jgi:DNA polymerase III delta prime subunit
MDKLNDNIFFLLDEKDDKDKNNEDEIKNMMYEFTNLSELEEQDNEYLKSWLYDNDDNYGYINDESFYEKEYTIKDLLKICNYYGIDKNVKMSKCKKQDIISTIVYFESLPENFHIVQKRNTLWKYVNELLNDPKMKKFIIWN